MQALQEPCDDVPALVARQAEATVAADGDVHAGAHELTIAIRAPPGVTLLPDHLFSKPRTGQGRNGSDPCDGYVLQLVPPLTPTWAPVASRPPE